jgi:stearoyl-CoA desaturase (Delta-9 desaturase)
MTKNKKRLPAMFAWFDSSRFESSQKSIGAVQLIPFVAMHLAVLAVFYVGFSWIALWTAVFLYLIRMFAITGFYHRYFSHKHFKTSRTVQFIFAFIGASSAQRGPLWWASHHRQHHSSADTIDDPHSPRHQGFIWSHTLWFLSPQNFKTRDKKIKDFAQYPELRWLDRFDIIAPFSLAVLLFVVGLIIENYFSYLDVTAGQLLVWGFFVSTVVLYHATYTINSLAHKIGTRRFDTQDDSRNNAFLALITLGEGWHNNHHYYAGSARQGFVWWELDITYYILKVMSWFGLVWDIKPLPEKIKIQLAKG